jgi:hypothetical protein
MHLKKKEFHKVGSGDYKVSMPKCDKMEHDCIAHGLISATIDWPERVRTYFYAHGGTINPEDGTLVPSDQIREIVGGTFVSDRERDELSAAIGTKEHGGCFQGKGAVPWKLAWCDQIDSYKSHKRSKDQQQRQLRELQDRVIRTEARMEQIIDECVALALSKQSSHQQGPTDEMIPSAKGKRNVASTEHALIAIEAAATPAVEAANPGSPEHRPHWPINDITVRSACELLDVFRNKNLVVAYGVAEKTVEGDSITSHHRGTEYYARVFVDREVNGWADLEPEIPGPNGEEVLQDAVHTWIFFAQSSHKDYTTTTFSSK